MSKHPYLVILALLVLASIGAYLGAQTTAGIMPMPQQFFDNSGRPLSGGKVYSYAAGTTTPLATYTDSTGGTARSNPIILDSAGRITGGIWLGANGYKLVVTTAAGVTLLTLDGLTTPTISTASVTIPSGQSLTLASGSTTSMAADLIPSGSRNLGSSAHHWTNAWLDAFTLSGSFGFGTTNASSIGSSASLASAIYGYNQYANKISLCGVPSTFSTSCYTLNPTINSTNSYVTLKDETGTEVMRWSQKEGGATTAVISTPLGASVPGMVAIPVGASSVTGVAGIITLPSGTSMIVPVGSQIGFGKDAVNNFSLSWASLTATPASGVAAGTVRGFCTNCTTATVCASGGAGHLAISDGTNWRCD